MIHAPREHAWTSERSLRIAWDGAPPAVHAYLLDALGEGIVDVVPGAHTITIITDPTSNDPQRIEREALRLLREVRTARDDQPRIIEIPARFDNDVAPDRARFPDDLVRRFCATEFRVAFFGFAPGFAYLEGLPEDLHRPRLDTPRQRVAPGSIAIADRYAAVYPGATPGGWNIIGRTDRTMFDLTRTPPALLRTGDRVRFVPASADRPGTIER
ncbi:MAG: allophanate hydrolase subunit 1 [Phycisphaerales bacterium]